MIGLPWYLLAAGIVIVILGAIAAGLPGPPGRERRAIDPDMADDEITRELRRAQRVPFASLVILTGLACILVSIGWRVARAVL